MAYLRTLVFVCAILVWSPGTQRKGEKASVFLERGMCGGTRPKVGGRSASQGFPRWKYGFACIFSTIQHRRVASGRNRMSRFDWPCLRKSSSYHAVGFGFHLVSSDRISKLPWLDMTIIRRRLLRYGSSTNQSSIINRRPNININRVNRCYEYSLC